MEVTAEWLGSAVVIHLEGRLTVESDVRQLHRLVQANTHIGGRDIVLDLRHVGQLDCSGISQLVEIHNLITASGGTFALVNVAHRHRRLLEMVGLLEVFRVLDAADDDDAVRGYARDRPPHGSCSAGVMTDLARLNLA